MAEIILYNIISDCISDTLMLLSSIFGIGVKIVSEVVNEIEKLESTVSAIRAVLPDAEMKRDTNSEIAHWLDKVEEAFYDANDVLNNLSANVSHNKRLEKVRFFQISKQFAFFHKIAIEIKAITARIEAIAKEMNFLLRELPIDEWMRFFFDNLAQEEDMILSTLRSSYFRLPWNLKGCFASCSLYLKDERICKRQLIQLWMSHGLIHLGSENDVGDSCFMGLLKQSFFEDVQRDELGDIISCKMHDLALGLARSVSKRFSTSDSVTNLTERTRHVSFGYCADSSPQIPFRSLRANNLQTLMLKNQHLNQEDFEQIVSTFKKLRVLDVSHSKTKIVPNNIGDLERLRYLDLSGNDIETLPNSITVLRNLKTLKLNECCSLGELPRDIKDLVTLMHIELDQCYALTGMPSGLGQLTSLCTLTRFVADSCSRLSELQSLSNLEGKLSIELGCMGSCSWSSKDARAEGMAGTYYLEAKEYLKTLALYFHKNDHDDDELLLESLRPHPNLKQLIMDSYGGVSLPSWFMADKIGICLPNLVRIDLQSCYEIKHLSPFGQLPFLQFLRLRSMLSLEYIENTSVSGNGGEKFHDPSLPSSSSSSRGGRRAAKAPKFFPSLKQLELLQLHNLKGWWRSEAAEDAATTSSTVASFPLLFPSLSHLTIIDCPNLQSMPILEPSLEQLNLRYISQKLVEQLFSTPTVCMTTTTTDTIATMPSSSSSSSSSSSLLPLSGLISLSLESISSLPEGLQYLTNLRSLKLEWCDNLMALPEWISNLTSLERVEFHHCPKLKSLPDGMSQLTGLQELTIVSPSNVLYDRCQEKSGTDWPKIAHIPNITIEKWQ